MIRFSEKTPYPGQACAVVQQLYYMKYKMSHDYICLYTIHVTVSRRDTRPTRF